MGLIVCPSRELARQTHEVIQGYTTAMKEDGLPELRSLLVMGGIDMRTQVRSPVHLSAIMSLQKAATLHPAMHRLYLSLSCHFMLRQLAVILAM